MKPEPMEFIDIWNQWLHLQAEANWIYFWSVFIRLTR